ncbi:hypothetical protein, partial [Mycobacterium tuberculosis]
MEYLIAAQDVLVAAAADLEGIGSPPPPPP